MWTLWVQQLNCGNIEYTAIRLNVDLCSPLPCPSPPLEYKFGESKNHDWSINRLNKYLLSI